ncbi:HDOD domain-containing protein [Colwellia sp. D2M02]|uniref:HDOD domain-containing protein n=1 Tax=Colwellia asteriadis TaxID=517723 RepID=A0ABN1L585_9GAMM|nr:HDOD domain-containing protein [Colwellia sp. D2M02]MBU2894152.1 HDOD domain-containing protein [Colwellia sp. D2M02]
MRLEEYIEQVSDVFVLSDSFLRIKELVDDEASTIDDISEVILLDPALAGSILKLANSSFFSYPGKIDTISKAVLVLGITEIYTLVLAYFTTEAFKLDDENNDYLEQFWLNSIDCALLIKFLGVHLNVANAERLFILGLLHNLGELVVHQVTPEAISRCRESDLLPWQQQRAVLGFSYGECSAELLKYWQLPYSLFSSIRNQDINEVALQSIETQLLYIAKRVTYKSMVMPNESIKALSYQELIGEELLEQLEITDELLANAVDYCMLDRMGMLSILCPSAMVIY